MSTSQIPAVKTALVVLLGTLLPDPVWTGYGHPGTVRMDDMAAVMDARSSQAPATLGSGRNREETISVDVVFSTYRGGNDQATTTARVFAMLAALETSLRTDPTIGGIVRTAQIADIALAEVSSPEGRVAELAVTIAAVVRLL